ncbi:cytochrome c biogenesis protein CcdA [Rhodobacteraceae bacterium NNCM2]|nr:cytochrome c biogenesis protein CcdA [Coraliihabitans acroporae]
MIIEIFWAFIGGLFSFLSPCVLPLAPPYIAYMAGTTIDQISGEREEIDAALRQRVFLSAVCFVLGLGAVFVGLGLGAAKAGNLLLANKALFSVIAGYFITIFGLHFIGFRHALLSLAGIAAIFALWSLGAEGGLATYAVEVGTLAAICAGLWLLWKVKGIDKIPLLNREARFEGPAQTGSYGASFLMGTAFAFGWTPCIGPFLGAVLAIAANGSVAEGGFLLSFYALGLGVPFLLAAWYIGPFLNWARGFRRHMGVVEIAMGALLVLIGSMMITGTLEKLANLLLQTFPILARIG